MQQTEFDDRVKFLSLSLAGVQSIEHQQIYGDFYRAFVEVFNGDDGRR
jgi:hypothetical protein